MLSQFIKTLLLIMGPTTYETCFNEIKSSGNYHYYTCYNRPSQQKTMFPWVYIFGLECESGFMGMLMNKCTYAFNTQYGCFANCIILCTRILFLMLWIWFVITEVNWKHMRTTRVVTDGLNTVDVGKLSTVDWFRNGAAVTWFSLSSSLTLKKAPKHIMVHCIIV